MSFYLHFTEDSRETWKSGLLTQSPQQGRPTIPHRTLKQEVPLTKVKMETNANW